MKNVILKIELDHAHGIDNNEQKKREKHRINFVEFHWIGLDKKRDKVIRDALQKRKTEKY